MSLPTVPLNLAVTATEAVVATAITGSDGLALIAAAIEVATMVGVSVAPT